MIVLNMTAGTTSAGTVIGLTPIIQSTNPNTVFQNNTVLIAEPGIYEISVLGNITATAAVATGVAIYANGNKVGIAYTPTLAISDTSMANAKAFVQVVVSQSSGYAAITLMPVGAPTIVDGQMSIKRIA